MLFVRIQHNWPELFKELDVNSVDIALAQFKGVDAFFSYPALFRIQFEDLHVISTFLEQIPSKHRCGISVSSGDVVCNTSQRCVNTIVLGREQITYHWTLGSLRAARRRWTMQLISSAQAPRQVGRPLASELSGMWMGILWTTESFCSHFSHDVEAVG